jgi:hypothetical protein
VIVFCDAMRGKSGGINRSRSGKNSEISYGNNTDFLDETGDKYFIHFSQANQSDLQMEVNMLIARITKKQPQMIGSRENRKPNSAFPTK